MQVLEQILEEILQYRKNNNVYAGKQVLAIEDIIRRHMDDGKDTDVPTNNGWIPVEERLPKEEEIFKNEEFIVMIEGDEKPTALFYAEGDWYDEECNFYNVIAWRQLPEPYKPVETKPAKNTQQELEDFWRDK